MTLRASIALCASLAMACLPEGGGTTTSAASSGSAGGSDGTGAGIAVGGAGGGLGGSGGEGGTPITQALGHLYGDSGYDAVMSLEPMNDDDIVIGGSFSGSIDFGAGAMVSQGGRDLFVVRLDQTGAVVWQRSYGTAADDELRDHARDLQDNTIVIGSFSGSIDFGGGPLDSIDGDDLFVLKLDPNGGHLASARFSVGFSNAAGVDVACSSDPQGNVVIASSFVDAVDVGTPLTTPSGQIDVFAAKLSPALVPLWSKQFGSPSADQRNADVSADTSGNIVLAGTFEGDIDFGGGPLTTSSSDAYVVKLNPLGNHIFSQKVGSALRIGGVITSKVDEIILVGAGDGVIDVGGSPLNPLPADARCFVVKLGVAGGHIWSRGYGCQDDGHGPDVAVTPTGTVLVYGMFDGVADFGAGSHQSVGATSGFMMGLYSAGTTAFSRVYGTSDTAFERVTGGGQASSGHFWITGLIRGDVDLGMGLLPHAGDVDSYLVKLKP